MKTEPKSEPMSTPNELQRYTPEITFDCRDTVATMCRDNIGDYVLWSDIEPLIRSHEALREALELCARLLDAWGGILPDHAAKAAEKRVHQAEAALAAAKDVGKPC